MAIIGNTYLGLIDIMKRQEDGLSDVVEALHTLNPVMRDANVITANKGTRHLSAIRTGLPAVSWGALYEGIAQGKSTTAQVEDTTGFIEGLSTVDKRLLDIAKDPAAVRLSEAEPYMESMTQEFEEAFWYADTRVSPRKFHGVSARYNTLSNPNVVNGGGAGSDNTSLWIITWGDQATSLITPEGIPAGIKREDKGEQRATDSEGNPYFVKEELFTQHVGVTVKDWRRNARVANIDVSDVIAGTKAVNPLLRKAYYKLHGQRRYTTHENGGGIIGATRTVIYMNKTLLEALDAEGANAGSADNFVRLTPREIQGEEVMTWRGIPIRETDNILNTEALVPA